ncbi:MULTISPECIES: type VII secretion protein EccE [Nocardia]|uniref:type VII secretion protein EccE n=1 Tax=Nocardia TaxID=1817 RepID=UPI0015EE989B|nr:MULTISPECIES: type VII secretion protein EccE [Nocardia]MBF6219845.1 type VII secretion protein EccE [Nocardia abscessus]MBF6474209.1 type VII secretion protein EccE [Nocardia abscessus]MDE1668213.1 type VII secretion protein EccE [Nocardia gipuzkoensis]UGT69971.1 type VII secretion protein EccE [Nocardia gipuzkoensis]
MAEPAGAGPRPLLGRISMQNLLVAQIIGLVVGVVALFAGLPGLPAFGVAVVVALIPLIPVAKRTMLDWIATWWRYLTRRDYEIGDTVDYRGTDGRSLGLYWDGSRVVTVVEVLPPPGGLTRIARTTVHASHLLPLAELAKCLNQHDILLSGIDIISHGHRSRSGTPAGKIYESLLGPLPATAHRAVWLAISFDAVACPEATARRGGGAEGASRAVTIATQRIMRTLEDADCNARILTAPEIRKAVLQITSGYDPRTLEHRWRYAEIGNSVNVGSAVDPKRLDSDLLAQLWVAPSRGTTVAVRLRPGNSAESVNIGAAWRLTARELPERSELPGMVSMNGRHRDGLLAHLPIAVPGVDDTVPMIEHLIDVVDDLHLPSSGCGQLIGSDDEGNGVAVRIVGVGISTVYVAGELYLAQQLVFRALAVGERILIRTDRARAWENLVTTIGNPERLTIAVETHQSDAGFTATVVDGVLAPAPHAGVTTIYVTGDPMGWPASRPDLAIHQPGAIGNHVVLRTGTAQVDLTLVSIPSEATYIGQPRGRRAVATH